MSMNNIEGTAAGNIARSASGHTRGAQHIATGLLAGTYFKSRGNEKSSRSSSGGGRQERSAEDWANENLHRQREHERQLESKKVDYKYETGRRNHTAKTATRNAGEGRTIKSMSADGRGGFKIDYDNAPVQAKAAPAGQTGNTRGKQFIGSDIPVRPGERPGSVRVGADKKFESNPAYGKWKSDTAKFDAGIASQDRTQLHLPAGTSLSPAPSASAPIKSVKSPRAPKAPKA